MSEITQITSAAQIPQTLNGYPVKALSISNTGDMALVLVYRDNCFQPWVAATWWPELGDRWEWGHYFDSYQEADDFRASWIRRYAAERPRIKLEGRIGGFQ